MEDIVFNRKTLEMTVFMRSENPVSKGVTAKAQKYLKKLGMYGAICWIDKTEPTEGGSITHIRVSHFETKLLNYLQGAV